MTAEQGARFWTEIRGYRSPAPPVAYSPYVSFDDDVDALNDDSVAAPEWEAQSITGRTCILFYRNAKQERSERLVLCRRLSDKAGTLYLDAFCYVRERICTFRVDRVETVTDPETGEVHDPGEDYLRLFALDTVSPAPLHYGLPPRQFADFNAALNVLTFMARCDGKWHPLEASAVLSFAERFWLRAEIAAPFDEPEIVRHAARLAPDAEAFWVSLHRCAANPILRQIIRRHAASVMDADGVHHPHEIYWGSQIDEFLST